MKKHMTLLYITTIILAACSVLYELLIAHTIAMLAANTVVWYSVTIGLFLGSLGFGSLLHKKIWRETEKERALFWTEIGLSLSGLAAPFIVHFGHMIYARNFAEAVSTAPSPAVFFIFAFFMTVFVGFFTGMELPLLIALAKKEAKDKTRVTNRILAVDYVGSLIGAVSFPLLFLPNAEIITIASLVALVNAVVALLLLLTFRLQSVLSVMGVVATASVLVLSLSNLEDIQQYFLQHYYYYYESAFQDKGTFASFDGSVPEVQRVSSPYQKIDIVQNPSTDINGIIVDGYSTKYTENPDWPINYTLFLNGDFQLNTTLEEIYHEYFAHVGPMMEGSVPENVLVLGGGDGRLIDELLKYDEVKKITHVDLDQKLIDVARTHPVLSTINHGAFDNERVETVITDGLQYMRNSNQQYDAIYIDFPYAVDYNLSKLYSAEFYHFVHERLAENGYAVFDATGVGLFSYPDALGNQVIEAENEWQYYYHTLRSAGFETIIPYVSNLERENEKAVQLIKDMGIVEPSQPDPLIEEEDTLFAENVDAAFDEYAEEQIRVLIQDFVWSMQQGFIFMKKGDVSPRDFEIAYHDIEIPLHVLNKDRFELAFTLPFPFYETEEPEKVNSVIRPSLPQLPLSYIRLPY